MKLLPKLITGKAIERLIGKSLESLSKKELRQLGKNHPNILKLINKERSQVRKPLSDLERLGYSKGNTPQSHVQGYQALQMFKNASKEVPKGESMNYEQLLRYVPEVRERYGLTGKYANKISDEEIAEILYKHTKELGGDTAAVNVQGEPQLLFRGDTKDYTKMKDWTEEDALLHGEDSMLGELFLGDSGIGTPDIGPDRYLWTVTDRFDLQEPGHINDLDIVKYHTPYTKRALIPELEEGLAADPEIDASYSIHNTKDAFDSPIKVYKLSSNALNPGYVNRINAFVVRTPNVKDITYQVAAGGDLRSLNPGESWKWSINLPENAPHYEHKLLIPHYKVLLEEAEKENAGLLKSNANSPFRDEHSSYDYFALPNFNKRNAKHLLPYDFRIPRNWDSSNIYAKKGGRLLPCRSK